MRIKRGKRVLAKRIKPKTVGGVNMSVLAKGSPIMFSIKQEKAKDFIDDSNKKVITESILDKWEKETAIFRKRK